RHAPARAGAAQNPAYRPADAMRGRPTQATSGAPPIFALEARATNTPVIEFVSRIAFVVFEISEQNTVKIVSPLSSPPTKRGYLERPGCRLYYEVTGAGPAIMFAHGLGGNHLSWWQQVPHFAGRYTCVTFAHRGFAPSSEIPGGPDPADYAGDLAALID